MGILRKRLQRRAMAASGNTAGGNNGTNNGNPKSRVDTLTKLAFILSMYAVWAAYTVSSKPHLKTQLKERFQLLLKDKNLYEFVFSPKSKKDKVEEKEATNNNESEKSSDDGNPKKPQLLRIPCGLILAGNDEDEVEGLPVSTCIEITSTTTKGGGNGDAGNGSGMISLLNDRIFQRYPQLQNYKKMDINMENIFDPLITIPEGTFLLRMGSVEATIEKSPELRIFQQKKKKKKRVEVDDYEYDERGENCDINLGSCKNDDDDEDDEDANDEEDDCDLVLGKQFWENHSTEFNDDELYVSTTATKKGVKGKEGDGDTQSEDTSSTGNRVMVPYIRIRKPFL